MQVCTQLWQKNFSWFLKKFRLSEWVLNLCQTCFTVTLLVSCLDKELIPYKTLSKYFMQALSFAPLVHISQKATGLDPNYTLHSQNYLQDFPTAASQLKFDVKVTAATDDWIVLQKHKNPGIKTPFIQKNLSSLHPEPLPNANSKTNKERVTVFLYQAVDLSTSYCSTFYRKRELGPDQVIYEQSRRWSNLHIIGQITRITRNWIYTVLKCFSPFSSAVCRSMYVECRIQAITINSRPVRQNKSAMN